MEEFYEQHCEEKTKLEEPKFQVVTALELARSCKHTDVAKLIESHQNSDCDSPCTNLLCSSVDGSCSEIVVT